MPNQNVILSDYEAKKKPKKPVGSSGDDSPELEPPMIREFAIHILQTIDFLQKMSPHNIDDVMSK